MCVCVGGGGGGGGGAGGVELQKVKICTYHMDHVAKL